jgi:hypothetical protein
MGIKLKQMKVRAFNIDYDTDGEDINLPYQVFVEVDEEDDICDAVSDQTGFCVFTLQYEII